MLGHSVNMVRNLQMTGVKLAELVGAMTSYGVLVKVIPPCVHGDYALSDRIVLDNVLLLMDDKLILPGSSLPGTLLTLHKGPFGMTTMKLNV
ncbi:hypothetical protein PR048_028431 [Dryococelus australis]|uniref:Uncharacterized protein n=1 Tax=Dryococelus australis TaxID=614101 RepID=A0ABQ9GD40_9NEOP|nr:hypothetical protein PR048_028431 [Dryococelus australis]